MAVNREYADRAVALHEGDEVALIPPVSGGSVGALHARVTDEPIALEPLIERVRDPRAGAVVTFQGVTREVSRARVRGVRGDGGGADRARSSRAAIERHGLCAAAAEHRIGTVPLSEPSVAVAASAPHRDEAFAGAREIIDEIKARAPIWKKEEGEWIEGTRANDAADLRACPRSTSWRRSSTRPMRWRSRPPGARSTRPASLLRRRSWSRSATRPRPRA